VLLKEEGGKSDASKPGENAPGPGSERWKIFIQLTKKALVQDFAELANG
jgi:hypothetical protein